MAEIIIAPSVLLDDFVERIKRARNSDVIVVHSHERRSYAEALIIVLGREEDLRVEVRNGL